MYLLRPAPEAIPHFRGLRILELESPLIKNKKLLALPTDFLGQTDLHPSQDATFEPANKEFFKSSAF